MMNVDRWIIKWIHFSNMYHKEQQYFTLIIRNKKAIDQIETIKYEVKFSLLFSGGFCVDEVLQQQKKKQSYIFAVPSC